MPAIRKWRLTTRTLRLLTATLLMTVLAVLLLAGSALATTRPGKPSAKTPTGTVTTTTPTFKWGKAARATKYELRVYQGSTQKLRKTGITKLSWKSSKTLPRGVSLTWKVRGRNAGGNGAWSKRLTFKVRRNRKAITAFSFSSPAATGVIDRTLHTIALTVPYGTAVTALVPTVTISGASVSPASGAAHDFSSAVTYTVTAANGTTQAYTVTVTVALNPAKAITAFSFHGLSPPVTGIVTEAAHTIALTVPFGTNVSALVATFTTTGASVAVGGTPQVSGTTAHNFSSQVTYRVTAANASTQDYTVTVTVAAAVIGQSYGGGKIAYILQDGDPGYAAGQTHGLIAAAFDQDDGAGIMWAILAWQSTAVPGGTGTAIGTGPANTDKIIAQNGAGSTYAAGLARAYAGGGYLDWYLPSKDELNKLHISHVAIGGFAYTYYLSSSEFDPDPAYAWAQIFGSGAQSGEQNWGDKYRAMKVRAVRSF